MQNSKFSLLLLEENEHFLIDKNDSYYLKYLLNDFSDIRVDCITRICTKSIILDPLETTLPILKIPYNKILNVSVKSENTMNSNGSNNLTTLHIITKEIIQIPLKYINNKPRAIFSYDIIKSNNEDFWCFQLGLAITSFKCEIEKNIFELIDEDLIYFELIKLIEKQGIQTSTPDFFFKFIFLLIKLYLIEKLHSVSDMTRFESIISQLIASVPTPSSFPLSSLISHKEQVTLFPTRTLLQYPLLRYPGILCLTNQALCFRPYPLLPGGNVNFGETFTPHGLIRVLWSELVFAFFKTVDLNPLGSICLLYKSTHSCRDMSLIFDNAIKTSSKSAILDVLLIHIKNKLLTPNLLEHFTELWRTRKIDTFHYLGFLNSYSGRTTADFSVYPVYPWTYIDFESEEVDLTNINNFRDLKKPIGAINDHNLELLKNRMFDSSDSTCVDRNYLYGVHYSTSTYIIYWLLREVPECQLRLQCGKFDHYPRLFNAIKSTWNNLVEGRASSYMELIPQFYDHTSIKFLKNELGVTVDGAGGTKVLLDDVELPKWAKNDPKIFLKIMREALESDIVSNNINNWFDLIFGFKQSGREAEKSFNNFHPVTYFNSQLGRTFDEKKNQNIVESLISKYGITEQALLTQVREFGQAPIQIFNEPHPRRLTREEVNKIYEYDIKEPDYSFNSLITCPRNSEPWFSYTASNPDLYPKNIDNSNSIQPFSSTFSPDIYDQSSILISNTVKLPILINDTENSSDEREGERSVRFRTSNIIKTNIDSEYLITSIDMLEDNDVYIGCSDGYILKKNLEDNNNFLKIPASSSPITSVSCISSNKIIFGNYLGHIGAMDTNLDIRIEAKLKPHEDSIIHIASEKNNKSIFTCISADDTISFWTLTNSSLDMINSLEGIEATTSSIYKDLVLFGTETGQISLWDIRCLNTGPIWLCGNLSTNNESAKIINCELGHVTNTGTFGVTLCSESKRLSPLNNIYKQVNNYDSFKNEFLNKLNIKIDENKSSIWEAILFDIRVLKNSLPLATEPGTSTISRFKWPSNTSVLQADTDGSNFAIAVGLLSHVKQNNSFVSVVDLQNGGKEACRWPLEIGEESLESLPWFIPRKSFNLAPFVIANHEGTFEILK